MPDDPAILEMPPPPADARLPYGDDPNQFGDLRLPNGAGLHPVVVVIHGGFWRAQYNLEHIGHLCAALTRAGFATWSIEYRRLGQTGGGWPGTFQDVSRAVDHLAALAQTHALDLDHVGLVGHSAGGHLALWLAAAPALPPGSPLGVSPLVRPVGAVALAGVCDLRRAWELGLSRNVVHELLDGSPQDRPERYALASPLEMPPHPAVRVLVHGDLDDIVPLEIAMGYAAAVRSRGMAVDVDILAGMGHFEVIDPASAAWPRVLRAVRLACGIKSD